MSEQTAEQSYRALIERLMRYEPRNGYQRVEDVELDKGQIELVVAAHPYLLESVRPDAKRLQLALIAQGCARKKLFLRAVAVGISNAARQFVFNDVQERIAAQQERIVATSVPSERAAANDAGMAYGVPA